jgi:hypothetical protein
VQRQHLPRSPALDDVIGLDLAIPCHVFDSTVLSDGQIGYEVRVCGGPVTARVNVHAKFDIQAP